MSEVSEDVLEELERDLLRLCDPLALDRAVCRRCEVDETCLTWSMESGRDAGVWGGLTEQERHALKRRNARTRPDRLSYRIR